MAYRYVTANKLDMFLGAAKAQSQGSPLPYSEYTSSPSAHSPHSFSHCHSQTSLSSLPFFTLPSFLLVLLLLRRLLLISLQTLSSLLSSLCLPHKRREEESGCLTFSFPLPSPLKPGAVGKRDGTTVAAIEANREG